MTNRSWLAPALAATLALAGCARGAGGGFGPPLSPDRAALRHASLPLISHVVIVVQENRSFDNFFATFPGADGATTGMMKTRHGDIVVPLKPSKLTFDNLGHEHLSFMLEYNHGKMDGFNAVKRTISKGFTVRAGRYGYRYVLRKHIQPYWKIAENYVLADRMFTTQSSSSFTAHQDLIAGGTPVGNGDNVIDFPTPGSWGCDAAPGTVTSLITPARKYLRDQGPFPCFGYPTMRDLLDGGRLSWTYFTNTSQSYVWDAFDAIFAVRYGSEWSHNVVAPETNFFSVVQNNALPAVSWVIPDAVNSDHPGNQSDTGPSWVAGIVNAIGESPYWQSTAIVVVWDDWGGEYDHVPPPQLDGQGLGMRVPMLLVSAYAREQTPGKPGYISHTQYEFGSILKFIEDNWSLGRLETSDVRANSLIDCFDYGQAPRAFIPIDAKYSRAYFLRQRPSGLPLDDD